MRRSLVAAMVLLFSLASCGGGGGGGGGGGDDGLIDVYFQNDGSPSGVNAVGYAPYSPSRVGDPLAGEYTWLDLTADPILLDERILGFRVPPTEAGYHLVMTTNAAGWHGVYTEAALADLVFVIDETGYHIEDPWTYPGGPPP